MRGGYRPNSGKKLLYGEKTRALKVPVSFEYVHHLELREKYFDTLYELTMLKEQIEKAKDSKLAEACKELKEELENKKASPRQDLARKFVKSLEDRGLFS